MAQALALPGCVQRRAPALRGAGPGRRGRADVLGGLGSRARRAAASARGRSSPGSPAVRSGPSLPPATATRGGSSGRPEEGGTLVRVEAAARSGAEQRARLPARRRGKLGRGDLRHRRGRELRLDPQAGGRGRNATCGSAGGGSAPRPAGSRTSRAAITPSTRSGTGRRGSARRATGARWAGTSSRGSTTHPRAPSARSGSTARPPSRRGELRGTRGDRLRGRRQARVHRRGRAHAGSRDARSPTPTASRSAASPARFPEAWSSPPVSG